MTLINACINFVLAFPLLWINGILGKWKLHSFKVFEYSEFGFHEISEENFSENFFQMIVHPSIYLALVCWVLQLLSFDGIIPSLWLLVPFYWVLRIIYAILRDTFVFTNWYAQLYAFFFSVLLSECTLFCIILPLLKKDESIFIDAVVFRDAFWYAALVYLAKVIWDSVKGQLVGKTLFPSVKKTEIIIRRYRKFQLKYDEYIQYILNKDYLFKSSKQRKHFLCLLYAIMIYEAHTRPTWIRILEYCVKIVCPFRKMSLGIMQVQTRNWIGNKMSIHHAIEKLYAVFSEEDPSNKIEMSIRDYNPSDHYCEQVTSIYGELSQYLNLPPLGFHFVKVTKRSLTCLK